MAALDLCQDGTLQHRPSEFREKRCWIFNLLTVLIETSNAAKVNKIH